MKLLKTLLIALFILVSLAFGILYGFERLTEDHTKPRILWDGQRLEVSVSATDAELCQGLQAVDEEDGDLTDRICVRQVSNLTGANSAVVSYVVFDKASNFCTFSREVFYTDYEKPRFHLSQPLIYHINETVGLNDRLTATDVLDGDLSGRIRVVSTSITNTIEGEYPLDVQVTNSKGDTATLSLTVAVRNYTSRHPIITLSDYLVYVQQGSTMEDLRSYIASAFENDGGAAIAPKDIQISGSVDLNEAGCYDITYSYLNSENLSYSVILTVVVV